MSHKKLAKGMGEAVARRTILRKKEDDSIETWEDVAKRVALGNASLIELSTKEQEWRNKHKEEEQILLEKHIASGTILMSGRHLQHGDASQITRNMEVFTNCSTATTSFVLFYLLLNGSGVGRSYDDDMCIVDWDYVPSIRTVLDENHADFQWEKDESLREAKAKYPTALFYEVPDSREGWASAVELLEIMAYEKSHKDELVVLDFSKVRPRGSPIGGMQNRPSSGPKPTMQAILKIATIKGAGLKPWKQAMWIDHYLAECVLVGGARRSARMATKYWKDPDILDFIKIKEGGFLWSANNSITVDSEFWTLRDEYAREILELALHAAYYHKTGEPGFINQDMLVQKDDGLDEYYSGDYIGSKKYILREETKKLLSYMVKIVRGKKYMQIVNPCGEISLSMLGGYCVIADVVPYHTTTKEEAVEAFKIATRALMRVNLMDSLYNKEVKRTNRIGIGMTGIHEYAWKFFGYGFHDLIDEEKSKNFWLTIAEFSRTVKDEAKRYAAELAVNIPHTNTTIKPAGTTSKLFGLTEGAHLPSMKEYMRWVQFRDDDPLVKKYIDLGYPSKELKTYHGTIAIGFPTQPEICKLKMKDKLVTAADALPEEQYKWLMLLEKYWIGKNSGNQVSYTLKYKPDKVSFDQFKEMIIKWQSQVRCCAVMPQIDTTAYEYQPEEAITSREFMRVVHEIRDSEMIEDIDFESLKCSSGSCPL